MRIVRMMLTTGSVMLLAAATASANLVINGTFTTDATGWVLSVNGGCSPGFDSGIGNPAGSVLLNACGAPTSDPTAAQTLSGLTVGQQYDIQADLLLHANLGGGTGKSFGIYLDNQPGSPILLTEFLDSNWHTVSTSFTATLTSHTIIFAAETDTRTPGQTASTDVSYYLDNVVIDAAVTRGVPEPAMVWLVGGGVGMLAFRRRTRV
jgi:hypothetical protein